MWQKAKKLLKVCAITVGCLLLVTLIVLFVGGYIFNWTWAGVGPYVSPPHPQGSDFQREKTLYDWFQLAIIPVALAVGVWWLNRLQQQRDQQLAEKRAQTERDIATDNQREAALQAYIDKISELLLHEHLGESSNNSQVKSIAQARTATVLRILDPIRRASLIQFLSQSGILAICVENAAKSSFDLPLNNENSLRGIELPGTNLNGVNLSMLHVEKANLQKSSLKQSNLQGTDLSGANLQGADLSHANLQKAILCGADLQGARLYGADLRGANLLVANLERANLFEAIIMQEQWEKAMSLKGATMPDGTKHP